MKLITNSEETRRIVNQSSDETPSIHHIYNYQLAKPYSKNKKLLDVGCWTGQFISLALESTSNVYGIDPGKEAISYAKHKYKKAHFKVGTADELPYKNSSFDVVTFLEVIEHIPKESETKSLLEICRVLKPKGILVLSTPSNHPLSILLDPAYFMIGHRHYGVKQLSTMIKTSGFDILEIKKTGGLARLISLIVDSMVKHGLKRTFKHPAWLDQLIEREYTKGGFAQLHVIARKA